MGVLEWARQDYCPNRAYIAVGEESERTKISMYVVHISPLYQIKENLSHSKKIV